MAPKRRAPSISDEPKQTSKRARFAEPEITDHIGESTKPGRSKISQLQSGSGDSEDDVGFSNEVEATLDMGGMSTRRKGGVKVAGYESDSTDDGEGVVLSRRKDKENGEDDDDDMFAVGEKEEKEPQGKKEAKYLELGDIEGQEFDDEDRPRRKNTTGDESEDEDSVSSSEPEDLDDAERRKKAGMGYELTKFNMKEEMEEGRIAEDGMYVKSYDAGARHDKWLDDVGEAEMKKARRAKRRADKRERERIKEEEAGNNGANGPKTVPEMECELLQFLRPHEDVLEALARLGKQKKKQSKKKAEKEHDVEMEEEKPKDASEIDRITALASALMVHDPDVYSTTYEGLLRSVRRSGIVGQDWTPPLPKYEYRWAVTDPTNATSNEIVYGPFSEEELRTWNDAMFFGTDGEKIKLRKVGESGWRSWDDLFA